MSTVHDRQLAATLTLALASTVERTDAMFVERETDWVWGTYLNLLARIQSQANRERGT